MNRENKTMLALAALAYRGFGLHSEAAVDQALRPWLRELDAEGLGKWDLVWGPATFRVPTSLFDDAMMFVAREVRAPGSRPRYAVAIRGTNPVSFFDWVFGDLFVSLPVNWSSATGAQISASTAIGLSIIRNLAAEVPPAKGSRLAALGDSMAGKLQEFAATVPELDPPGLLTHADSFSDDWLLSRIDAISHATLRSRVFSRLSGFLAGHSTALKSLQSEVDKSILDRLLGRIQAARGAGQTLVEFLNQSAGQNATVAVTGHSKGGALSVAAALWLAENWAPARQGEIECFSFAGPTAGNQAFVQRYNSRLAGRTSRVVNARDIVPQAWVPENLKALRAFYPLLAPAIDLLSASVAPLGYLQVGGQLTEIASHDHPGNLLERIIYQHLDAYLEDAAFRGPKWKATRLLLDP